MAWVNELSMKRCKIVGFQFIDWSMCFRQKVQNWTTLIQSFISCNFQLRLKKWKLISYEPYYTVNIIFLTVISLFKTLRSSGPQITSSSLLLKTLENIACSKWTTPRLQSSSVIFWSICCFSSALRPLLDLLRIKSSTLLVTSCT